MAADRRRDVTPAAGLASTAAPATKHVVVLRGAVSPAVVIVWIHCALTVGFVVSLVGRGAVAWSALGGPVGLVVGFIGAPLLLGGALLNAWVVTKRELVGYLTSAGLVSIEWTIFSQFAHSSVLRQWRTAAELYAVGTAAALCLEVVWFAARHRVRSVADR